MNHVRWVAWGVIDPDDATKFDRMQRRNYIKRMRAELADRKITLDCGGSTAQPWYKINIQKTTDSNSQAYGGRGSFQKVCRWLLEELGEHLNERSEDGGVRCAGAQTQGPV